MNVHVPELPHLVVFEVICGFEAWYWSFKTLEPLWTAQYHLYVETCESEQTQPYVYHSIYHVLLIDYLSMQLRSIRLSPISGACGKPD